MEWFEQLSDWIWVAVAAIWVLTRLLPRLLRRSSSSEPSPRRPDDGAPIGGRLPQPTDSEVLEADDMARPRPIEPR